MMRKENEELKEVLTAVQLDLEARQSELNQRDSQLRDTNTQLVNAKARIVVSLRLRHLWQQPTISVTVFLVP